jgi:VanZ family protein
LIPTATPHHVRPAHRTVAVALLLASLIAVAVLTLTPTADTARISFWCLKCGERTAVDLLLNILLFVPLGAGLGLYGVRFRRAAFFALACTCLIEALQFFLVPGRYASSRDILANFAGALIGYSLGRHWRIVVAPNHGAARMLATMAAILWLATQAFTAWAMGISPPPEPWWAQLRPNHEEYPSIFTGQIIGLSVGSIQIRHSDQLPSDDADAIREQILAGAPFRVVLADVAAKSGMAPIAIISAGPVHDVVWWVQDERDGAFSVTVRGTLLGLRTPSVRIGDVFPKVSGDTIALTGSYRHGWYELQAANRSGVRHRELRASPSWGWAFLLPFPLWAFGSTINLLTAFYLVAVWCALGYWNARSVGAANVVVPVSRMAIGILLGLGVAPIIFAVPVAHWSEWLAAIVGGAAGWTIAQAISSASCSTQRSIRE